MVKKYLKRDNLLGLSLLFGGLGGLGILVAVPILITIGFAVMGITGLMFLLKKKGF